MNNMTNEEALVAYIRRYAEMNYTQGWDEVVEAWSDGDILELLSDNQFDLPKTMKLLQSIMDVRAEIKNTAF
jgi:hypothetical protein